MGRSPAAETCWSGRSKDERAGLAVDPHGGSGLQAGSRGPGLIPDQIVMPGPTAPTPIHLSRLGVDCTSSTGGGVAMQDRDHLLARAGIRAGTQALVERTLQGEPSRQLLQSDTAGSRLATVSRSEQGLPQTVDDDAIIAKVTAILRNANGHNAPPERRQSSPPRQAHTGRIKSVPNLRRGKKLDRF